MSVCDSRQVLCARAGGRIYLQTPFFCCCVFYQAASRSVLASAELYNCLNCLWQVGKVKRFMMKTLLLKTPRGH